MNVLRTSGPAKIPSAEKSSRWVSPSVNRFGNIRQFGKFLYVFGNFLKVYFVFGKIVNLLWQFFNAVGQMFLAVKGQRIL